MNFSEWLKEQTENMLLEMATVNLNDNFKDFSYPTYRAIIKGGPREHLYNGQAHIHISNVSEGWEIRMTLDGNFLSIVKAGKRNFNDKFTDIEKIFKKWLKRKSKNFPEITNYVYIQREWNTNNPEHQITIKSAL